MILHAFSLIKSRENRILLPWMDNSLYSWGVYSDGLIFILLVIKLDKLPPVLTKSPPYIIKVRQIIYLI